VAYPGTHDNATVADWLGTIGPRERANVDCSLRIAGADTADPVWGMVHLAHAAPARLAVVSAQDLLGLGREARMNTPSRRRGNWRWRLEPGQLTDALAERLAELTFGTGRAS